MDNCFQHIPEGLEIVSVGALYAGPSDKKYWSSSRGKDRYPYPVGYHALRTYAGITYKMEIKEGIKGPLFMVTAPCGDSFSGRTPDVAWGFFWKKNGHKVRNWKGKRFCGKIDGIEFFGFRNPIVLKLLRELVASVQEVADTNMMALESEVPDTEICESPDLVVCIEKRHGTQKRSKRSYERSTKTYERNQYQKQESGLCQEIETSGQHTCQGSQADFAPQNNDSSLTSIRNNPGDVDSAVPSEVLDGFLDSETKTKESPTDVKEHDQIKTNLDIPDSVDVFQDEVDAIELLKRSAQVMGCYPDDMAKSMMALLLPSAVPLLAKMYKRKRKKNGRKNKSASKDVSTAEEIRNYSSLTGAHDVLPISKEHITDIGNLGSAKVIVPDSLDDDLLVHEVDGEKLISGINESYPKDGDEDDKMDVQPDCNSHEYESVDSLDGDLHVHDVDEEKPLSVTNVIHPKSWDRDDRMDVLPDCNCHEDRSLDFLDDGLSVHDDDGEKPLSVIDDNHLKNRDGDNKMDVLPDFNYQEDQSLDTVDDDFQVHDIDGEKPVSGRNDSHPKNREADDKMDEDDNSHEDPSLDDNESSTCILRNSDANCMEKDGNILESVHSNVINCQKFPLDPEGMTGVAEESLYASQQETDSVKETNISDEVGAGVNKDSAGRQEIIDKIAVGVTKDPCLVTETLNPLLLADPSYTFNTTAEEPSFKVPFSEIIILRDINIPHTHSNLSFGKQCDVQNPLLQDPKEKFDKVDTGLNQATFSERMKSDEQVEESAELIGCYLHPFSVLSVQMRVNQDKIYICTLCGFPEGVDGFIFLYCFLLITRPACPSFLGYTSIIISSMENADEQRIPVKMLGLQLTPDGEHLVFSNYVKVPFCREKNVKCSCIDCKSDELTSVNAIKIVRLDLGFASSVAVLKTTQNIHTLLACETNLLLGIEESGSFRIWRMDSSWRLAHEEFILPGFEFMIPSSSELKHIPKCGSLILGHNGAGSFCLWDVSARVLLSKFCASGRQVSSFLPLGFFYNQESFLVGPSPKNGDHSSLSLLVKEESSMASRLSLVVNNSLLLGDILDIRESSVGALNDVGIIGTSEGNVYLWELTSGKKLGEVHSFTGKRGVTCIVTDEKSGVIALVGDVGEMTVYLLSNITS